MNSENRLTLNPQSFPIGDVGLFFIVLFILVPIGGRIVEDFYGVVAARIFILIAAGLNFWWIIKKLLKYRREASNDPIYYYPYLLPLHYLCSEGEVFSSNAVLGITLSGDLHFFLSSVGLDNWANDINSIKYGDQVICIPANNFLWATVLPGNAPEKPAFSDIVKDVSFRLANIKSKKSRIGAFIFIFYRNEYGTNQLLFAIPERVESRILDYCAEINSHYQTEPQGLNVSFARRRDIKSNVLAATRISAAATDSKELEAVSDAASAVLSNDGLTKTLKGIKVASSVIESDELQEISDEVLGVYKRIGGKDLIAWITSADPKYDFDNATYVAQSMANVVNLLCASAYEGSQN